MTKPPSDEWVAELDRQLIEAGVPLHARPFEIMVRVLTARGGADILAPEIREPVMDSFRRLYPSGDFSVPKMLTGGVGLRDRFYLAAVTIGYGTFGVDPLKSIQIPATELDTIWRLYPDEGWRALYSVADLWDIAYGIDDSRGHNAEADVLWNNAKSAVEAAARLLASGTLLSAVVQNACLTAELSMKAALTTLGAAENERRQLGHDLEQLANKLITYRATKSDARLRMCVQMFPDYVKSRYSDHGLSCVALNELVMRAQYVAGEAARRVSARDFVSAMKSDVPIPPRRFP